MVTTGKDSTEHVLTYVRELIARGELRPGDRLPAERDLSTRLGVSRPTIRAGLRALSAMGVVKSRHGSGTYIPDGPPTLGSEPLRFLAALHGLSRDDVYEARRVLEVSAAGLAAKRASAEHMAAMVSALYYEHRRDTAARATDRNLRDAADLHRGIYQAIRKHDIDQAQTLMNRHLLHSAAYQAQEDQPLGLQTARLAKGGRSPRRRAGATGAS
jgi:GntR family transcriptional regulator, transcriptional repressor for pyruvate dehydrogenase complex